MTLLVLDHNLLAISVWTDLESLSLDNIVTTRHVFPFEISLTIVHFYLLLPVDYCALACKIIDYHILCQDLLDVRPFHLSPNKRWRRKSSIVALAILAFTYFGLMLWVRFKTLLMIECKRSYAWDSILVA